MRDPSKPEDEVESLRSFPEGPRDLSGLRVEIDRRRERLARTAHAIGHGLSPGRLVQPVAESFKEAALGGSSTLARTVKENPVALLLSAAGLGWLFLQSRRREDTAEATSEPSRMGQGMAAEAEQVVHAGKNAVVEAGKKAGDVAHRIGAELHHLARSAKRGGRRATQWFSESADSRPFVLGALSLAIGFLGVMAVPQGRKEEEFFSGIRKRFLGGGPETHESGSPGRSRRQDPGSVPGLAREEENL